VSVNKLEKMVVICYIAYVLSFEFTEKT